MPQSPRDNHESDRCRRFVMKLASSRTCAFATLILILLVQSGAYVSYQLSREIVDLDWGTTVSIGAGYPVELSVSRRKLERFIAPKELDAWLNELSELASNELAQVSGYRCQAMKALDMKLAEVRTKVNGFSNTAGKAISSTLMRGILGVV